MMRQPGLCCADDCDKPRTIGFSFIFGTFRFDFCSADCAKKKLDQLVAKVKKSFDQR